MEDKVDWKIVQIQDIAQVIRGASPRPKGDKRYYGGNVPRLMVEDVTRDGKYVYPSVDFLTEEGAKLSRPCTAGTLTIVCSGTVGVPSILGVDACIHDGFLGLVKVSPKVSVDYLYHFFCTQREKFNNSATHGGVFTNLTTDGVKAFEVKLPIDLAEQEKIATALSDTDALISELEKLIEKKQAIKIATMQQLLTGKTRLPEFALREDGTPKGYKDSELGQIPEDWEVCKFEKLCKVFTKQTGFDYSAYIKPSLIKQYKRGHIPFVQNKDFEGKNFNFDTDYYIPKDIAEKFPNILLNEKCLLISISGSIGNVGLFNESSLAFIGGAIAIAKFIDPNKLDWVMYYMLSQQGQNTLLNNVKAGSHQNITLEDIRKFSIPLPSDMEQNLITSMLSSLDAEIKNLDFRLDKLKRIKLGMMQELLTGKTRLV